MADLRRVNDARVEHSAILHRLLLPEGMQTVQSEAGGSSSRIARILQLGLVDGRQDSS